MIGFGLILLVTIFRIVPHPANFTPMGAMAVFSGRVFPKKYAIQIALLAMLVSDFFLSQIHGYEFLGVISFIVYGAFAIQVLIGRGLRKRVGGGFLAAVLGGVSFFLITNLGVWAQGALYPRTMEGLIQCYVMALPFLKMTLLGDVVWTGVLTMAYRYYQTHSEKETAALPAL